MNYLRTCFVLFITCFAWQTTYAQPSRITSYYKAGNIGLGFQEDSAVLVYKSGNNNPGNYDTMSKNSLRYDSLYNYKVINGDYYLDYILVHHNNSLWLRDSTYSYSILYPGRHKYIFKYDGAGNMIDEVTYDSFASGWRRGFKQTYTYSGNNMLEHLMLRDSSGVWLYEGRITNSYDGNGNVLTTKNEDHAHGAWYTLTDRTYTYNNLGLNDTLTYQGHQRHMGTTRNTWKYIYLYDANKNQVQQIRQAWDTIANDWGPSLIAYRTYNAANQPIKDSVITYDHSIPGFRPSSQTNYDYYPSGRKRTTTIRRWDNDLQMLTNDFLYQYEYNVDDQLTMESRYNGNGNGWDTLTPAFVDRYHYSGTLSANQLISLAADINIYPNPAQGMLNVQISTTLKKYTLAIYNITGRLVDKWEVNNGNNYSHHIPVAHLDAGNYVLTIESGGQRSSRQFVVGR